MTKKKLELFLKYLKKDNLLAGPRSENGVLNFVEIEDINDIEFTNEIPLQSFKKFLLPMMEVIDDVNKKSPCIPLCERGVSKEMALVGLTIIDLKAITILNHIFEKDPFYQNRLKNTLIIGYGEFPCEYKGHFASRYEEDVLEHIQFDIFIVKETSPNISFERRENAIDGENFRVFTGSEDGQRLLDKFGYKDYENVQFAGLIKEEGISKNMMNIREAMGNLSPESKVFEDLGKRCIECGRCSIICPLCFCFCLKDGSAVEIEGDTSKCRLRESTTCFYSEFSEVAGGHKFLKNPAERIYNWYEHKFVRFPDELSVAGCVSCGRCARVCPAGISIREVISSCLVSVR